MFYGYLMRLILFFSLLAIISGCSLFGTYTWQHPQKSEQAQAKDKSECLALASIVYGGSPEALLALAKNGTAKPNKGVEADCLAKKGFQRVFQRANT